jgi:hypothetical protein
MIVVSAYWIGGFYLWPDAENLFLDAHIYFRATEAWLDGANPWTVTYRGVPFAGLPPTLLLNVPLVPFGERLAIVFWVASNTAGIALVVWRLRLPAWTLLLLPVVEGWLAGSPDLALAGILVLGGGWLAAMTKPYSVPALVAGRRWQQLGIAVALGLLTAPFLPWVLFYESREIVLESFTRFAGNPVSAYGNPTLMIVVVVALLWLGWRRGLILSIPGLLAQQPHYLVFTLESVTWSRILALAMTTPVPGAAAVGVVIYAAVDVLRSRR